MLRRDKTLKLIGLSYGVMVALQFLVLPVQVRILVRQLDIMAVCQNSKFWHTVFVLTRSTL